MIDLAAIGIPGGIILTGVLLVLLRDWRFTVPALLAQYLLVGLLVGGSVPADTRLLGFDLSSSTLLQVVTGLTVAGLFATTSLRLERARGIVSDYEAELDEFALAALRRRQRLAVRAAAENTSRRAVVLDYLLPSTALLISGIAAYALSAAYPVSVRGEGLVNFSFYWVILCGVFVLVLARDIIKLSEGLLVTLNGLSLLLAALATRGGLLVEGLTAAITIGLAAALSYLWVAMYERRRSLSLEVLRDE